MEPVDLYTTLLELGPDWRVSRVEADHTLLRVDLYLEYLRTTATDPGSGDVCAIYDWRDERVWRHLDTMQYKTFVHARLPRIRGRDGRVVTVAVPWAEASERRTWLFEAWSIQVLLACKNQTQSARLLRLSFDELHRIMERSVERGLLHREEELLRGDVRITHVSIDEKCYRAGRRFLTVLSDPKHGRILEVAEGRTTEAAVSAMMSALAPRLLTHIQSVSIDMAESYRQAVLRLLPQAEIVYDKFHLIQYLTQAIDQVRRQEIKLSEALRPVLTGTRFLWLKNPENHSANENGRLAALFDALNGVTLQTAQAWRVRENFHMMYYARSADEAREFFQRWKHEALATGLTAIRKVVQRFETHLQGILHYFHERRTSAMAERLNGKIQELKVIGKGYKSVERIRIAILFFFGNLNLLPHKCQ